jgi:PAS domain S-box-containing protein
MYQEQVTIDFDLLPLPYQSLDMNGYFLNVNKKWLETFGYKNIKEILGKHFSDILPDNCKSSFKANFSRFKQNGKIDDVEYDLLKKDGSTIKVNYNGRINNGVTYCIFKDITDNILLEQEYHTLFDIIKEGVVIYETKDNGDKFIFKDINPSVVSIENVKKHEILGKELESVFPGARKLGLVDALKKVYKTGKPILLPISEYKDKYRSGWKENHIYKLLNGDVVVIYSDKTKEYKQIEKQTQLTEDLEFQKNYLNSVFDALPDIAVTTYGDKIYSANRAFMDFFSLSSIEEFTVKYDCICDKFENTQGYLTKTINEQNWLEYIYANKNKVHKVIMQSKNINHVFIVSAQKIKYDELNRSIVLFSDITELMKKDALLIQQSKMASMGEMLESIAHQWRQPLSVISASASGAKFQKENDLLSDEALFEMCDSVTVSVEHLSETIDDFRDFFNQNKKKVKFQIKHAFDKTVKLTSSKFKNREIEVIDTIVDINLVGVENELVQVLMNLFTNAKDELENKEQRKLVFVCVNQTHSNIVIQVKDNAGGIPVDFLTKVFDQYFTTKSENDGTGIGLYMSKRIIEDSFLGKIEVENESYKYEEIQYSGACFTIRIPLS